MPFQKLMKSLVIVFSFFLLLSKQVWAVPVDLDGDFGQAGSAFAQLPVDWEITYTDMVLLENGQILATASVYLDAPRCQCAPEEIMCNQPEGCLFSEPSGQDSLVLTRYNPDGSVDENFGNGGFSIISFPEWDGLELSKLAVRHDGKIVVMGYAWVGPDRQELVGLLLPDGQIDPDFGHGGFVTGQDGLFGINDDSYRFALQADGKILVSGRLQGQDRSVILGRIAEDGSIDDTFGNQGSINIWQLAPEEERYVIKNIFQQPDGKILTVGGMYRPAQANGMLVAGQEVLALRFFANGEPDAGFGAGGKVSMDVSPDSMDTATKAIIGEDGRILLLGNGRFEGPYLGDTIQPFLIRLMEDGRVDPGFGENGIVRASMRDDRGSLWNTDMALDDRANIVVSMTRWYENENDPMRTNMLLARYRTNGRLDRDFGNNGFIERENHPYGKILIQDDGKLLLSSGFNLAQMQVNRYVPPIRQEADLEVRSLFRMPVVTRPNRKVVYDFEVTNHGPIAAQNTKWAVSMPGIQGSLNAKTSQGRCQTIIQPPRVEQINPWTRVECLFGVVEVNARISISVVVLSQVAGVFNHRTATTSQTRDPDEMNNSGGWVLRVGGQNAFERRP
ncbi:MAG: hypothetical protein A2048_07415 [Deltaproteobacteria bacterium GWA2_45_12]|nr:MAG: hypothetical protein A2048_07415 [Deltaproteobacteria bacterium GWA2_45_12]